ncbi:putative lipoyltransferase 2, mitochondrial [Teleopsis dalmanni]|uniref:putative lipoyltransferase 2, mitochondrial n=1 Tax=Teleopsis dalmanni TaxID=139649 RepID=UPI0018CCDA2F|nr:putative lipoyltransferase 2, mitochondrial [Teleopsis dalmanni]
MKPLITVIRAGRISYGTGLLLQKYLCNQRMEEVDKFRNYILLQEFNPVYTTGLRTKEYTKEDEIRLRKCGAEFYRTNRGGLITFHGHGQLVAYPIIHLRQFKLTMRLYIKTLEETVINACQQLGVLNPTTTQDTGIWVNDNKICAIGVHGSRFVTTHGIGLNCSTDLEWFEHIIPCGIEGKGVTSLSVELKRHVSIDEASNEFIKSFANIFNCRIEEGQFDANNLIREAQSKAS